MKVRMVDAGGSNAGVPGSEVDAGTCEGREGQGHEARMCCVHRAPSLLGRFVHPHRFRHEGLAHARALDLYLAAVARTAFRIARWCAPSHE